MSRLGVEVVQEQTDQRTMAELVGSRSSRTEATKERARAAAKCNSGYSTDNGESHAKELDDIRRDCAYAQVVCENKVCPAARTTHRKGRHQHGTVEYTQCFAVATCGSTPPSSDRCSAGACVAFQTEVERPGSRCQHAEQQ